MSWWRRLCDRFFFQIGKAGRKGSFTWLLNPFWGTTENERKFRLSDSASVFFLSFFFSLQVFALFSKREREEEV